MSLNFLWAKVALSEELLKRNMAFLCLEAPNLLLTHKNENKSFAGFLKGTLVEMPPNPALAPVSPANFLAGKKPVSEKKIAHARAIAKKGAAAASLSRTKQAKKKKLNEAKVLQMVKQMILQRAGELVRAAFVPAMGQHFVYEIVTERNEKGTVLSKKHVLISDPERIAAALDVISETGGRGDDEDEFYYVTVKEPDFRAVDMLMNRSIGKVPDTVKVSGSVEHKFSLMSLAQSRKGLPPPLPVPVEVLSIEDPAAAPPEAAEAAEAAAE